MRLSRLSLSKINLQPRWRRLKARMAVKIMEKTRKTRKAKGIKISPGVQSTAQSRIVKQIKCVTAITGMVLLLGTASTPTTALGRTRSRRNEGPAGLEKK